MAAARSQGTLWRRCLAEFVGSAFLLLAIVGSGIAAARLAPGEIGLQLLFNAVATGVALAALITAFGAISGAHLNPLVSVADLIFGGTARRDAAAYTGAQLSGAIVGVMLANIMFGLAPVAASSTSRGGVGQLLSEALATGGLLFLIFALARRDSSSTPFVIGGYIAAAILWSSSTSFANPAVTLARSLTDTFAGIAPSSVVPFILAQIVGAAGAILLARVLLPDLGPTQAHRFVAEHEEETHA